MPFAIVDTATSRVVKQYRRDPQVAGSGQLAIQTPSMLENKDEWRWDGAAGVRAETVAERDDRLDAEKDAEAVLEVDSKLFRSISWALAQQIPGFDRQEFRRDVLRRYKQLT